MQVTPETHPWRTNLKAESQPTPATLPALVPAPASSPPGHLEKYWARAGGGLSKNEYFEKNTQLLCPQIFK